MHSAHHCADCSPQSLHTYSCLGFAEEEEAARANTKQRSREAGERFGGTASSTWLIFDNHGSDWGLIAAAATTDIPAKRAASFSICMPFGSIV